MSGSSVHLIAIKMLTPVKPPTLPPPLPSVCLNLEQQEHDFKRLTANTPDSKATPTDFHELVFHCTSDIFRSCASSLL